MVSSGTVTNDASTLEQYLNSYKSEISGLEGSWKGTSYDSITSQADAFVSEYSSIVTQMNNFASACESYEAYKSLKATIAKTEADRANAADSVKYTYDSPLAQMNSDLEKLKSNINNFLASASAVSLTASAVNVGASAGTSAASATSSSTTAAENKAFIESILSEEGNTISDYSGFNDGQWCADFVSEMLNRNGYNIEPSSIAGHESDNTIFKSLERAGATIHLDQAAQYNGESADDYTPQPGDVVLFDFAKNGSSPDGTTDHVGFVIQDNGDGTITTIEGNTSGPAGGSCVAIHDDRSRDEVYGYATPVKNHD